MANDRLRTAITNAGLEFEDLARIVDVDPKTVQRWLSGRTPYSRHRTRIATALHTTERDLWPNATPGSTERQPRETIDAYPAADDPSAPDWRELMRSARDRIDLLDDTLIHILDEPDTPRLLLEKGTRGCTVRILIADGVATAPDPTVQHPSVAHSDSEIDRDSLRARELLDPLIRAPGIEIRTYPTQPLNSILRFDDHMLAILRLHGVASAHSPLLHLHHDPDRPGLFDRFADQFNAIWDHIAKQAKPDPQFNPRPLTNPRRHPARHQST